MLPVRGGISGGSKPPPYPVKCISCVGNGLDRSANLPVYGEVARAKRVTESQVTSKSTGGRGNRRIIISSATEKRIDFIKTEV